MIQLLDTGVLRWHRQPLSSEEFHNLNLARAVGVRGLLSLFGQLRDEGVTVELVVNCPVASLYLALTTLAELVISSFPFESISAGSNHDSIHGV